MTPIFMAAQTLPTNLMTDCDDGFMYCFASWASTVTGGLFWGMAMITFAIVTFLATSRYGSARAFGFSSFILLIGGVWLSVMKLIAWWLGSAFIIVGVIGLVALILNKE